MSNLLDHLVIGRGVAGTAFIHYLFESLSTSQISSRFNIGWIAPKNSRNSDINCSLNSTAMVARQGIITGISPLGDLLVESFEKASFFLDTCHLKGLEKTSRYHMFNNEVDRQKLLTRFGDIFINSPWDKAAIKETVYLIEPFTFLKSWQNTFHNKLEVDCDDYVVEVEKIKDFWRVLTNRGEIFCTKSLIDATGAYSKQINLCINKPITKNVIGHYLRWDNVHFDKSFVVTLNGHNLIYRSLDKVLLLSGTTVNDQISAPKSEMYSILNLMRNEFPDLIPNKEGVVIFGNREKGRKRMPFVEDIDDNFISIGGFYKNGYTFCHTMGKLAVNKVLGC